MELSLDNRLLVNGSGNDLRLYTTGEHLTLKNIQTEFQNIKSVKWNPFEQYKECAVIASGAGRISIVKYPQDCQNFDILCELTSNSRVCNVLAWSPVDNNILLTGFDRQRGESGLLFWDVQSALQGVESRSPVIAQFGSSQPINSAAWANKSNNAIVGMGYKWIRSYDIRGFLTLIRN